MPQLGSVPPPNPLSYEGQVVVPFIGRTFNPQSSFNTFPVPTIWINTSNGNAYILSRKPLGVADWVFLGGPPGSIDTITTPDMVVVVPSAGNINFLNGTGMNITGSGNNITFNSIGAGFTWNSVAGTSQTLVAGNAYVPQNGSLTTFTLPTSALFGDTFIISGFGAGGWTIAQNSGQSIIVGSATTTTGASGSLASITRNDTVQLVCVSANTGFKAMLWQGSLTVT